MATEVEVRRRFAQAGFGEELVVDGSALRERRTGDRHDPADLAVVEVVPIDTGSGASDHEVLAVATAAGEPVGTLATAAGSSTGVEAAVVVALRTPPISPDEVRSHGQHDHLVAVFGSRDEAASAVAALRAVGLGSEHLGLAVRGPGSVAFEHDEDADAAHDLEVDVAGGAVVGALAGFALFGLVVPVVGVVGVGGLLALGASSAFGGAMLGGYLGAAREEHPLTVHDQIASTPLEEGEVLVAVCSHGHAADAASVLERHGARLTSVRPD